MNIPTPTQLPNGKWKVNVRSVKFGFTESGEPRARTGTFDKKNEAEAFARSIKAELDGSAKSSYHDIKKITVGGVLRMFVEEGVDTTHKESSRTVTKQRLNKIQREEIPLCMLNMTQAQEIGNAFRDYRDKCQRPIAKGGYGLKGSSTTRCLAAMQTAFKWAIEKKRLPITNPLHGMSKPDGRGTRREFIWTEDLFQKFLDASGFDMNKKPEDLRQLFPWAMLLAWSTGYRAGDLRSIQKQTREQAKARPEEQWKGYIDLSVPEVFFPGTVEGEDGAPIGGRKSDDGVGWHSPLHGDAVAVIERLLEWFPIDNEPEPGFAPDRLFPFTYSYMAQMFQRLKAAVANAHPELKPMMRQTNLVTFHGLRHTFTTALVSAYVDPSKGELDEATKKVLLEMTGRRTVASLMEYVHLDTGALAKKLNTKLTGMGLLRGLKGEAEPQHKLRRVK